MKPSEMSRNEVSATILSQRSHSLQDDEDLMTKARAVVVGRKIKERKRKLLGDNAPAQALKVRKKDEVDFTDEISEVELQEAAEELRTKLRKETEKKEAEDVLHVPLCKFTSSCDT